MILKNLFKGVRNKVMIALAGLTMVFGVGAAVSNVVSTQQNEVVETKAAYEGYLNGMLWGSTSWTTATVFIDTSEGDQFEILDVYMHNGAQFTFKDNQEKEWKPEIKGGAAPSFSGGNGSNCQCGANGYYNFYFKRNYDTMKGEVYIERASTKTMKFNISSVSAAFSARAIYYTVGNSSTGGRSPGWPGLTGPISISGSVVSATIPTSANLMILNNNNGGNQTVNITTFKEDDTYYIWTQKDGSNHYTGHWGASQIGTFVVGDFNDWQGTDSNILSNVPDKPSNYFWKTGVSMAVGDEWLIRVVSSWDATDVDYGPSNFSMDGSEANDDADLFDRSGTNLKANANGTYDIYYNSSSHQIFGYYDSSSSIAEGYYLVGDGWFTSNDSYPFSLKYGRKMLEDDPDNTAYLETAAGIYITADTRMKIRRHQFCNNTWITPVLAGSHPFAEIDAEDDYNVVFSVTGNYNFYFHIENGVNNLYIVDVGAVNSYGHLYFASSEADTDITVTTYASAEEVISKTLDKISGVVVTPVTVSFDGYSKLYRIPIYNLRGAKTDKIVTSATFSDGSRTITEIPNLTSSPEVYAKSGAATDTKGKSAKALFDVAMALADDASLCDLSSEWSTLKSTIETGYNNGDTTLMNGAAVESWSSTAQASKKSWTMQEVYLELCVLTNTKTTGIPAWPLPASLIPAAMKNNQSPLTTTLWIVFGCGLAGLGAIGTAYFVSKKKKKNHVA